MQIFIYTGMEAFVKSTEKCHLPGCSTWWTECLVYITHNPSWAPCCWWWSCAG